MGQETKNGHAVTSKNPKGAGRPRVGKGNGKRLGPMQEDWRMRISTSKTLKRLLQHAGGELKPNGKGAEKEMTPSQVTAALSLLDRVLPKISQAEIKHETTERVISKIEIVSVAPEQDTIEYQDTDDNDNQGGSASG
jgi:hypothetical protein